MHVWFPLTVAGPPVQVEISIHILDVKLDEDKQVSTFVTAYLEDEISLHYEL